MKSMRDLLNDWKDTKKSVQKLDTEAPRVFGVESVRIVRQNFTLQGYDSGAGVKAWPKRSSKSNAKYDHHPFYRGTVYSSRSPLLMQQRKLYYGVQYWAQRSRVNVGVEQSLVPYAKLMNEGGWSVWLGDRINIPPRQYIPKPSESVNPKIITACTRKYDTMLKKAMKTFKK